MDNNIINNRDYTLIIDQSGSMSSVENGMSLWKQAAESTEAVAREIIKRDPDGITLYTFNDRFLREDNVASSERVKEIFEKNRPGGTTNLSGVLKDALDDYFDRRAKGEMVGKTGETILVVTDGCPNNRSKVKDVIIDATKKCHTAEELAISFFQIGEDEGAKRFLKKLDDDLQKGWFNKAKFDIVDTKTFDELEDIGLEQALIAAIRD